jgi:hypothetical protein
MRHRGKLTSDTFCVPFTHGILSQKLPYAALKTKMKHPKIPQSKFFGRDAIVGDFFTIPRLYDQMGIPLRVYLDGFDDKGRVPLFYMTIGHLAASEWLQQKRNNNGKYKRISPYSTRMVRMVKREFGRKT